MAKKLTAAQLRMAALGNNMMEAGAEIYKSPEVRKKIKNNLMEKDNK
jgi:hypothetical protein